MTWRPLLRTARSRLLQVHGEIVQIARRHEVSRAIRRVAPAPDAAAIHGATLFFVPYAGVGPMFAQACVVARTLRELGHRVVVARCFELFDRCPVTGMYKLPHDASTSAKRDVCLRCADNSLAMLEAYGLDAFDLRHLVDAGMLREIDTALSSAPDGLLDFEFDGRPFGLASGADLATMRKISDHSAITARERDEWLQYLRSCIISYALVDRACRDWGISRIVHVNDYSLLLGARMAANKNNVPCYGMSYPGHRNVDLRRYSVLPNIWVQSTSELRQAWNGCRDLALAPETVREVADDLLVRFSAAGMHVYSPPKARAGIDAGEVKQRLGFPPGRKLLVAYTSSLDEGVAIDMGAKALGLTFSDPQQPFVDQIDWLSEVIDYVERSDDLQLVVRVHPREAPNKREAASSQHLVRLRRAFGGSYEHVRIVWPQDPVSSYDLGETADLALTWGSTIGLELGRLGVPVLAASNTANYVCPVDDFLEWSQEGDDYFQKLREILQRPVTLEQITRAYRWYDLLTLAPTVDMRDLVPHAGFDTLPAYSLPAEARTIEDVIIRGRNICEINAGRLRAAQRADSAARESDELRRQLRRVIHFLMTGEESAADSPLRVADRGERTDGSRCAIVDGDSVRYVDGGRIFTRTSPMAARLVRLCSEHAPVLEPSLSTQCTV